MDENKWMLMTYYCPTHGNRAKVDTIQLTRQEFSNNLFGENKSKKNLY